MLPATAAARHRAVAQTFADRVAGVADWSAPSPVEGWSAREVVGHLISWFRVFLAAGGITTTPGPDVADDPVGAWAHHRNQIQRLLDGPKAEELFTHPMVGSMPLEAAIDRFYTADVFMHTWDLARATGQDDHLDEEFCAELLAGMSQMEDALRASGQYGPAVPVPDDAPVADRLLGFIGRDPRWR